MVFRKKIRSLSEAEGETSGLAYGIDIQAHWATLHNNLPKVCVLAHGLETILI
jgi:predicted Rossmann fold nucleotide-binding protein DprA/Smf involved in DNA uptake